MKRNVIVRLLWVLSAWATTTASATLAAETPPSPAAAPAPEACVIGGAEIYREALSIANTIHLTRVHASVEADTFFPPLDAVEWEEVAREDRPADARHGHPFSFVTLRRR